MKTQLLEDIGENAALPLAPPRIVGTSTAAKEVHKAAPAAQAQPSRPRSASGVWRQAPPAEPPVPPAPPPPPQSEQEATARELDSLIEELAVLEAQYVPPGRQPEPAPAPAPVQLVKPAQPLQPPHEPVLARAEARLPPDPTDTATVPQDPLFDFTTPAPQVQEADPFTPVRRGPTQTRRYLLWTACLLSGVLLIAGGRWLYEERKDGGSPALVAGAAQGGPRAARTAADPAPAAAVTPAVPASRPVTAPPPLVMLEPDPPAAVKPEAPSPAAANQAEAKAEPVAEPESAAPAPKPPSRKARKESASAAKAAAEAARERRERAAARQLARASGAGTDRPAQRETGMEATLRACREHGYHAAQCIKRDCSVTEYGFVCRGR